MAKEISALFYNYCYNKGMLYIFMALAAEAKPLIKELKLKQNTNSILYPNYSDSEGKLTLVVTGVGPIASASCLASILASRRLIASLDKEEETSFPFNQDEDFILNIGTCASKAPIGSIFLVNKLIDTWQNRTFYPDCLISLDLNETSCFSSVKVLNQSDLPTSSNNEVFDMEAAFLYQAAAHYLSQDKMIFLKIVSDNGLAGDESFDPKLFSDAISNVMIQNLPPIIGVISKILCLQKKEVCEFPYEDEIFYKNFIIDMKASVTMTHQINQIFRFASTLGLDYQGIIQKLYDSGELPCQSKREGLALLEKLTLDIIYS